MSEEKRVYIQYNGKSLEINPFILKFINVNDFLVDTNEGIFIDFSNLDIDTKITKVQELMDMSYNFLAEGIIDTKFQRQFEESGERMRMLEGFAKTHLKSGEKERSLDNYYKLLELICDFRVMILEDEKQNQK